MSHLAMKPASHDEATPGTPAEVLGSIITPQHAHAFVAGLAQGLELTPPLGTPLEGVATTVLNSRPHPGGRSYMINIHGANAISQLSVLFLMKTSQKLMLEVPKVSSKPLAHDTVNNTPPVTAAVTEFNHNGDKVTPSQLPLILSSPFAQLPMEQALEYIAQVGDDHPPAAVDPVAACAFKRSLVRRRIMSIQWDGASFSSDNHVDVLWSPKMETGIVLDHDGLEEIYVATEIRAMTAEEIGNAMFANYRTTGGHVLKHGGPPMMVDRSLLPEPVLIALFMEGGEGSREEARKACKAELEKCVQWVDQIDQN